jgi:hypothetical protein
MRHIKFLYFTTPGALILDKVLATKVETLSDMPYLVQPNGQSHAWSPYRYAVYLRWMYLTAASLDCTADELELTLFAPPQRGVQAPRAHRQVGACSGLESSHWNQPGECFGKRGGYIGYLYSRKRRQDDPR